MQLTIGKRLFLALTVLSIVILGLNAVAMQWSFERGFLDYVATQEAETLDAVIDALREIYESDGHWDSIQDRPRGWNDLLRRGGELQPSGRPPRRGPGAAGGPGPGGPPPHQGSLDAARVALLDSQGSVLVGAEPTSVDARSLPIEVDEAVVGFVVISPPRQLVNPADQDFARQQQRAIIAIAAAALLFAAILSAVFARQITRPINAIADSAQAMAAGKLEKRIAVTGDDELARLAENFNHLAATLEKNRASRQRWVADIAHELRTPLAILRGELDALEDGVRDFDVSTRISLQAETRRLSKLVEDLHLLSVYDEGRPELRREPLDIGRLLEDVLDNGSRRLSDAGIELQTGIESHRLVFADRGKLDQVFMNLLENTLRYTDSPGSLLVGCRDIDDDVEISFADSAPGIPNAALDHLFDRLFRADPSRSREFGGSGLGLSICQSIIKAHGGTIAAGHALTGGLKITIRLPVDGAIE